MAAFPFVGASYTARSKAFDSQRCVNLYPEVSESGPAPSKSVLALIGTPGLALWAALAGGGVRGLFRFSAAQAVAVVGGNVYLLTTAGAATLIGTIGTGTGPVSMASNGSVVMLVDGSPTAWVITPASNTLAALADAEFTGADVVYFLDGYFVFNQAGTGRFQITGLYGTTVDGLDFATAEGAPDLLVSLLVDHRELWLFGETTTEVWFNSGNVDFPFERIQGAFIEHGCAAKFSPGKLDNTVYWLAADDNGQGVVLRASGYQPQRVSTHALEFAIAGYERIDDAVAWVYQQEGHSFYVLNFPTASKTWVFDAATGLWHERAWRDTNGILQRHRGQCHMAFGGQNLVGDWETGNIYRLDLDVYTDNGAAIPRIRSCPHLAADGRWQFFNALQVDMEAGVGLDGAGQGTDPQAALRWSDDGGFSWAGERWAPIGAIGQKRRRVRWRRLGKSRDRVFELTITDPVKVVIVGATVEAMAGAA